MSRYAVLINFTEKGISAVTQSVNRVEAFKAAAAEAGATVEAVYWTLGPYDGLLMLDAPDETTAAALTLQLGRNENVRTCALRAFDAEEFQEIVGKLK